ncbi:helix-turn-helix transcriptional regulator [Pseudoalteromonas obscura]|uniref:AlpA family phage regulatory protein n=1 Tax=Pseudoalteromonas obscura TaxID=3048491 RepID=A0ABT7ES86_9GAMM|nr:AlpA family phage regulatory protein [Pseudoalteromonas sp. P94(2023)]MDK2597925.1 AlpA family phage regulatory protein [Pseudoalteromonas sp. P94(2023)]
MDNYRRNLAGDVVGNDEKFLRVADVVEKCSISRPMIYKLMAQNKFPPSHKISSKHVIWLGSDVDLWRSMDIDAFHKEYGIQLELQQKEQAA